MRIQFEKIKLHNFMSFTDATIILNTPGYISVTGENNNKEDNSTSNGSGKSAIFEAILWCLTGETQRGTKDIKRIGSSECSVELTFKIDNDEFVLRREL